jgi:hypothetical protein
MSKWIAQSNRSTSKGNKVANRNLSATALENRKRKKVCSKRQEQTTAQQLLSDAYDILINLKVKKIRTKRLLTKLCCNENNQWATCHNGNKIGPRQLASMLHEFGIASKDIRFRAGVFKGYYKKEIVKAWRRMNKPTTTE